MFHVILVVTGILGPGGCRSKVWLDLIEWLIVWSTAGTDWDGLSQQSTWLGCTGLVAANESIHPAKILFQLIPVFVHLKNPPGFHPLFGSDLGRQKFFSTMLCSDGSFGFWQMVVRRLYYNPRNGGKGVPGINCRYLPIGLLYATYHFLPKQAKSSDHTNSNGNMVLVDISHFEVALTLVGFLFVPASCTTSQGIHSVTFHTTGSRPDCSSWWHWHRTVPISSAKVEDIWKIGTWSSGRNKQTLVECCWKSLFFFETWHSTFRGFRC